MDNWNSKTWYQSKTIWGAIVALLAVLLKALFEVELQGEDQGQLAEILKDVGISFGAALAIYGRVKANKPIKG